MKLPKAYDPHAYEADIYALWEQSGAFTPQGEGEGYSIVVPPPNANGNLHIGHALTLAIEDIAVRYQRMQGKRAVLIPGADHAGFETQVVYEKQLAKEGKSRFDFSRDELYGRIMAFVGQNRDNFSTQIRRLGAGVDWSRFTFTLDEKVVNQAYATFKKMWDDGLIYRGERLVNFCTFHGTAFADIEVVHREEQGHLWQLKYPLTDGSGKVVVATTRPETMLGDTAVAVHPDDKRYKGLVGKTVRLPLTNREIPIIADDFVDPKFGTGAVKITPAHDPNDFEAGKRHDLPMISVIDEHGNINHEAAGNYHGLSVEGARSAIVKDLEEQGVLQSVEDHMHSVGHCYKCDTVIQPLLREQWFIDMQPLAAPAIKALQDKKITFYPDSKRTQLVKYLEGLRDWNISRQIAWGIPIPAFRNAADPEDWIFDTRVDQELIEQDGKTYHRDPDVFDTWFSSSSWPYVTTNFPDSDDFKDFYPLAVMETGGEILYPWVSRMLMLGLYVTGEIPFKSVYIHGYVMAEDGAKMSKSLGNVINPIEVIDQYGSDALRMGIIATRMPAINRGYDHRKVEDARNFCNKLWNIARFIEDLLGDDYQGREAKAETPADHWILGKLTRLQTDLEGHLANYRMAEAYDQLYHFVWDDLADWYVEVSKSAPNKELLAHLLESVLLLLHPFAPFVTETIWQTLAWEKDSLLATRKLPKAVAADTKKAAEFSELQAIIVEVRTILQSMQAHHVTLYHSGDSFVADNATVLQKLTGLIDVKQVEDGTGLNLTSTNHLCWLDIDSETAAAYIKKLVVRQGELATRIELLEGRLKNKSYVDNAPKELIDQTKSELEEAKEAANKLIEEQKRFS